MCEYKWIYENPPPIRTFYTTKIPSDIKIYFNKDRIQYIENDLNNFIYKSENDTFKQHVEVHPFICEKVHGGIYLAYMLFTTIEYKICDYDLLVMFVEHFFVLYIDKLQYDKWKILRKVFPAELSSIIFGDSLMDVKLYGGYYSRFYSDGEMAEVIDDYRHYLGDHKNNKYEDHTMLECGFQYNQYNIILPPKPSPYDIINYLEQDLIK